MQIYYLIFFKLVLVLVFSLSLSPVAPPTNTFHISARCCIPDIEILQEVASYFIIMYAHVFERDKEAFKER